MLARVVARYHLFCHAHCLMGNHYDLLNGVYSQAFNRRHERAGMRWKAASAPPRTKRRRRPS